MKIAMTDPSLFTGRYDDSLCAALARRGHDVRLLGRPLRATDAIEPVGYRYVPRFFRMGETGRALLGEGVLGRVVKAADYGVDALIGGLRALSGEVVHAQWLPFAWADARLLARLAPRAALVHTVHNARPYHGDGGAAAQGRGYTGLLPCFDALIVHGEATREALAGKGIDMARVHIVPHPPMRLATAMAADLAAVPATPLPRVLFFGTIRPYKGLDLLVAAALMLWREGLAFELAIAGKPFMPAGPLLEPVHMAGFGQRLVTDLGFLTEGRLDAHLRRASIIAFPYRSIDSSGAFLSALDYGAAMVTSDAGMFGDLAESDVARFPAGDAGALADALRPLIHAESQRQRLGTAARALGARLGGWDEGAAATEQVYAEARARFASRTARA
ncbi:MAG TPA: glycosyltransferase family 4 protein [Sphingobium sp.]|nr:glycosyltransferase family 4 protein [Sphingobium sp.]